MIRRPPSSPPFPYPTLFRSALPAERPPGTGRTHATALDNRVRQLGGTLRRLAAEDVRLVELPKDRKSTRLNSSHANISYAVFCLKKKRDSLITAGPWLSRPQ